MSILVVGSVAYDSLETPFGNVDKTLGGSATYISLASSYFADPVQLVGVVGTDFSDDDIRLLRNRNIDLGGLQFDKSGKTFFWAGRYHYDLNERDTLDTQLNVFEHFDPVIPPAYAGSDYVCLGNIAPNLQMKVLRQVENPRLVVMDTMNFWIEGAREDLLETLKRVNVLIINDSEARELAGEPNLIRAAQIIRDMGPESLIIKKGEHGALFFMDSTVFSAPAFPVVDIHDPTGAGDTFLGGFIGWLARTDDMSERNMRRAVIFGSVMASYCVEEFGTKQLMNLSRKSIDERYQAFRDLCEIPEFD